MNLVLPALLICFLIAVIGRLIMFLLDVVADIHERPFLPEVTRVMRTALAAGLIGALLFLGWHLIRVFQSLG